MWVLGGAEECAWQVAFKLGGQGQVLPSSRQSPQEDRFGGCRGYSVEF